MKEPEELSLKEAVYEAKSGNKEKAINLIRKILRENPKNTNAWLLLSKVVNAKEKKIYCLEKVLEIDPKKEEVIKLLTNLTRQSDEKPEYQNKIDVRDPISKKETKTKKNSRNKYILLVFIVLVLLSVCCLIGYKTQNIFIEDGKINTEDGIINTTPEPSIKDYGNFAYAVCASWTVTKVYTAVEQNRIDLYFDDPIIPYTADRISLSPSSSDTLIIDGHLDYPLAVVKYKCTAQYIGGDPKELLSWNTIITFDVIR